MQPLKKQGFSLIEILVVMVILVILGSILTGVYLGSGNSKKGDGKAHTPMQRAKDTVCLENLHSVRISITAAHTSDAEEKFPASLNELRELPAELKSCAEGKEPYQYDPATGQVSCVHPGHEKY